MRTIYQAGLEVHMLSGAQALQLLAELQSLVMRKLGPDGTPEQFKHDIYLWHMLTDVCESRAQAYANVPDEILEANRELYEYFARFPRGIICGPSTGANWRVEWFDAAIKGAMGST